MVGSRMSPRGSLGLGSSANRMVVALLAHVGADGVQPLDHAVERGADVLPAAMLGALAAAPHHERLGAEAGSKVDVAQHLGQRVAAYVAVVGGERALLEHRVAEQVGGHHLGAQPGVGQGFGEPVEGRVAAVVVRQQVVVVEADRRRSQLGQLVRRLDRVQQRPAGGTEDVDALPAHRPEAEGELVFGAWDEVGRAHVGISCQERVSELVSTAASTRCTCSPSANDGVGWVPSAIAVTRSTTWWVKPCS